MQNTIKHDRLRAVFSLRKVNVATLARRLDVTERYVYAQLGGAAPLTGALVEVLREMLGTDGWAFATGETNTLHVALEPHELRAPVGR